MMSYSEKQIRYFAVSFSLLISLFMVLTNDIINRDGILYVNVAAAYLDDGLTAALQLFDWPFFSILIAYTHKITTLSFENSALFLNTLFFALFINSFLNISNKLLPNSRQLLIAAILIFCFSLINDYRTLIMRDIGYWAFCILTLYRFIIFVEKPTLKNASIWQIVAVTSLLFRVEGIVILLTLPCYLFVGSRSKQTVVQYLQLNYLFLIAVLVLGGIYFNTLNINPGNGALSASLSLLNFDNYFMQLDQKLNIMETQILSPFAKDYSGLVLISGLLVMLFYKLMNGLSLFYIGLYIASWWQRVSINKTPYSRLLIYFVAINLIVLNTFLLSRYFISIRYCMMALVGLLLFMLPRICAFIESLWLAKNKKILSIIGILLFVSFIHGVTHTRSKAYIKETVIWASKTIPENSRVLTNSRVIQYYFLNNQPQAQITIKQINTYQQYDYLILIEDRRNKELKEQLADMSLKKIYSEKSKRGDRVSVYKIID